MVDTERRKHRRRKTEVGATVHKKGEDISVSIIDIGQGGLGLISERGIFPGTEVDVTVDFIDDYAIHGTVKWAQIITRDGKTQYRVGIAAARILTTEDILEAGFPERPNFVKRLFS